MPTLKICLIIIAIACEWALLILDFEEYIGRVAVQDKMSRITKIVN